MKPENCIEVKHVNSLSVPYLSRFFGSAGTVLKVQKEEVSKYVTIVRFSGFSNLQIKVVWKRPFASVGEYSISAPSKSGDAQKNHPLNSNSHKNKLSLKCRQTALR